MGLKTGPLARDKDGAVKPSQGLQTAVVDAKLFFHHRLPLDFVVGFATAAFAAKEGTMPWVITVELFRATSAAKIMSSKQVVTRNGREMDDPNPTNSSGKFQRYMMDRFQFNFIEMVLSSRVFTLLQSSHP